MDKIEEQFKKMQGHSLVVLKDGEIYKEMGKANTLFNIASIRKTILSALYGIYINKGIINLDSTLEELQIQDTPPELTSLEKQATIKDLLKMRSGVYHQANYETIEAKNNRPERESHKPKEFYYYNNWDANVAGTIFMQLTGQDIFQSFWSEIGKMINLQDFNTKQCEYKEPDINSIHRAYIFKMSARDLARFGDLYANQGNFKEINIVPKEWILESTQIYSQESDGRGVGYYWYIENQGQLFGKYKYPSGSIGFSGYPGHFLLVIPSKKLVVVYEHDIFNYEKPKASSEEFGELVAFIEKGIESSI
jgi:CubicO group peptidase (beta-lactamase class C family)